MAYALDTAWQPLYPPAMVVTTKSALAAASAARAKAAKKPAGLGQSTDLPPCTPGGPIPCFGTPGGPTLSDIINSQIVSASQAAATYNAAIAAQGAPSFPVSQQIAEIQYASTPLSISPNAAASSSTSGIKPKLPPSGISAWLQGTTDGVPNTYIVYGAAGVLLVMAMLKGRKGKKRR